MSVSMGPFICSRAYRELFTKFSTYVASGRGLVILWRRCNSSVLPVLWMTSCFPIVDPMAA